MAKIRILVLTSSTGGGHDARAEAFAEWCYYLYRDQVDVRIERMLERSSVVHRSGVGLYNSIQRAAPWVHKVFYAVVEGLSFLNRRTVTIGRGYYTQVLREYRPHLIFSVHDCLNRGYFQLARSILGADQVRCATYCGEFSGGWGYSRNWIEPTVDLYISRTTTARDYSIRHGIPPERASVRGSFMSPRARLQTLTPEEKHLFMTKHLGLKPGVFTVFLATGGNGAHNHFDLLPALTRHASRLQVIIICGKNRESYRDLLRWRSAHPELTCYIEGYSEIVHLLMQVSDVIVTRGGTTTCAKALYFECPIIFNAFGGIMPQEMLTWKYFRNAGSPKIESAAEFAHIIDGWMKNPSLYEEARRKFARMRSKDDCTQVIDDLVRLANEVAGETLARAPFPPAESVATIPGAHLA